MHTSIAVSARRLLCCLVYIGIAMPISHSFAQGKKIVYITPALSVKFWLEMKSGIESAASSSGYSVTVLDSMNSSERQLTHAKTAIEKGIQGIVLSPTDSKSAVDVLNLAQKSNVPVVISDIGTNEGNYVSFVTSDNYTGARGIGVVAAQELNSKNWKDIEFGIIGIPQSRRNGRLRTDGFRAAMNEYGITKEVSIREMKEFTPTESHRLATEMLRENPKLRLIFVQSDQQTIGVVKAVSDAGREGDVVIAAFDLTFDLLSAITAGKVVGTAMQQPKLIGKTATKFLIEKISGVQPPKEMLVEVMTISKDRSAASSDQIKLKFSPAGKNDSITSRYPRNIE
jgi:ribose transport system substrate-binding protein